MSALSKMEVGPSSTTTPIIVDAAPPPPAKTITGGFYARPTAGNRSTVLRKSHSKQQQHHPPARRSALAAASPPAAPSPPPARPPPKNTVSNLDRPPPPPPPKIPAAPKILHRSPWGEDLKQEARLINGKSEFLLCTESKGQIVMVKVLSRAIAKHELMRLQSGSGWSQKSNTAQFLHHLERAYSINGDVFLVYEHSPVTLYDALHLPGEGLTDEQLRHIVRSV